MNSNGMFILQNHFVAACPTSRAAVLLSLSQACDYCDLTHSTLSASVHVIHSSPLSPPLVKFLPAVLATGSLGSSRLAN